jgi:Protein of unknown function (DUF3047)
MEKYNITPCLRGLLKKLLLTGGILVLVFGASTSPLAIIALNTTAWAGGRYPSNWKVLVNHGKPDVSPCKDDDVACLHLRSVKASFALERSVDVDPSQLPFLTWRWKVTRLPGGGDFRHAATDDQAAQVLVGFADHRVLTYLWDSTAPKGTAEAASSIPLVRIFAVVCESGTAQANRWIQEGRNLAEDYQRAYGRPAPRVKGLRIQINSQHTGTVAESYFGEVAFRNTLP